MTLFLLPLHSIGPWSRFPAQRLFSKRRFSMRGGRMTKRRLLTAFITQSGQRTEAELRRRTIGRADVDTLTVALDNMPNKKPMQTTRPSYIACNRKSHVAGV